MEMEAPQATQPGCNRIGHVEVKTIEGFGSPWVVKHRAVILWSKLLNGQPGDLVRQNAIVGAHLQVQQPDGPRLRVSRTLSEDYCPQWIAARHDDYGELLVELPKEEHEAGLGGCLVAKPFLEMYTNVTELCYKRIYEENMQELWGGNRDRMPSLGAVTAKLMRPNTVVLHATAEGSFVGGAIVTGLRVPSTSCGLREESAVIYVDSLATLRGSKAGKALWKAIIAMPAAVLALHSIPLESTTNFWTSCGMRLVDPSNAAHRDRLADELVCKSGGLVEIELDDLCGVLPRSELPLFLFVMPEVRLHATVSAPVDLDADDGWGWLTAKLSAAQRLLTESPTAPDGDETDWKML
eukprot:gnl/TRDRNA2_/TRDRNA2_194761_c0_seq1.p1 gnl/TRDRNA2_/TRDRNA2_194761_c0~~gnl/TRDRNA2_/TRDRNA2_194761_c0_seq1.p1  ORF type:complete len:362 (-),score=72.30 gnl/TRDRNA2_/TRDRNA2_194761_c0_seq1:8-1063(-)